MRRRRSTLFLLALALALLPARAEAQSVREFLNYCTSGSIRTCASTRVETVWDAVAKVTRVKMLIQNLEGWLSWDNSLGSAITRVAITSPDLQNARNLKVGVDPSDPADIVGTPTKYWTMKPAANWELGGQAVEFLATTSTGTYPTSDQGAIFGCSPVSGANTTSYFSTCRGGWVSFSFTTSNYWEAANSQIAWKVYKTTADGRSYTCRSDDPSLCGELPPVTTTPEPASMLLLGSGLAGLAAARRRRRNPELTAA